jgi:hypothetical protein
MLCTCLLVWKVQISADIYSLSIVAACVKPRNYGNRFWFLYKEGKRSSLRNVVWKAQTVCSIQSGSQNVCIVVRSLQTYPAPCLHYHIMAVRTLNCKKQLLSRLPIARVFDYPKCRQFHRGNRNSSVGIEISLLEGHPGSIRSRDNMFFPSPKDPHRLSDAPSSCSMGTWGTAAEARGWPLNSTNGWG